MGPPKESKLKTLPQVTCRLRLRFNCKQTPKAAITDSNRRLTPASIWNRFLIGGTCIADSTSTGAAMVLGFLVSELVTTYQACLQDESTEKQSLTSIVLTSKRDHSNVRDRRRRCFPSEFSHCRIPPRL